MNTREDVQEHVVPLPVRPHYTRPHSTSPINGFLATARTTAARPATTAKRPRRDGNDNDSDDGGSEQPQQPQSKATAWPNRQAVTSAHVAPSATADGGGGDSDSDSDDQVMDTRVASSDNEEQL